MPACYSVIAMAMAVGLFSSYSYGQVIQPLLPTAGTDYSYAQSINSSGLIVGYSADGGYDTATLWRPTTDGYVAEALPTLAENPYGGTNFITPNGLIAGYAQPPDHETATAVVWRESSPGTYASTPLPAPDGAVLNTAYSINPSGTAVGYGENAVGDFGAVAWLPNADGNYAGPTLLPSPPNRDTAATAINRLGEIAGYSYGAGSVVYGIVQPVVWRPEGDGQYKLHTVFTAHNAVVTAINQYGIGAGVYDDDPLVMSFVDDGYYAFSLPMPSYSESGASNAVNSFDGIVGYIKDPETSTPGDEAALWIPTDDFWDYVNLDRWLNETDAQLGAQWTLTDALSLNDNWLVTGNGLFDADGAPGGTPAVERAFVLDVSSLIPELTLYGDFDDDGVVSVADIDLLLAEVRAGTDDPLFDLDGDGLVDRDDLTWQIQRVLATNRGDSDIDGDVDLDDLSRLAAHYDQTSQGWAQGDFNGDGDVDLADLTLLATHYSAGEAQALADFQTLVSVPEPRAAMMLVGLSSIACIRRRTGDFRR